MRSAPTRAAFAFAFAFAAPHLTRVAASELRDPRLAVLESRLGVVQLLMRTGRVGRVHGSTVAGASLVIQTCGLMGSIPTTCLLHSLYNVDSDGLESASFGHMVGVTDSEGVPTRTKVCVVVAQSFGCFPPVE